jgi:rhamnosyltransferase subunit B
MREVYSVHIKPLSQESLMKILINFFGSLGDALPFVAIGKELQRRGHTPHLIANGVFERVACEAGLAFTANGPADELTAALNNPDATDPIKGLALLAKAMADDTAASYRVLCRAFEPGNTLVLGSSLAWGARLFSETHQVQSTTVHLAPSWFRSEYMAPSISPLGHLERTPRFIKRWGYKAMDNRFLDPLFTEPFNRIRVELKLAPVQRTYHDWMHQADLTLGMFPEWFAAPQPDWPKNLKLTGFPLYDHGNDAPLPADVAEFLAAGAAPVGFTTGTANASSHAFFASSVRACERMGRRGILLTQHAHQLPPELPPGVAHFNYVPFKALLPRLAAFVHHGGIGTTSQAMLAGVPQLIRPMGFDQFDNASRAMRLGVAQQLLPRRYRAHTAARALDALISNAPMRERCQYIARDMNQQQGAAAACDAILGNAF